MAYDGVMEDVRKAIALQKTGRLPVLACSEEFDVKWHGRYSYEEVCQDGRKMAEVWIAAIEHFGDRVLIEGSCAAPYSSVGLLFGLEETMMLTATGSDLLERACDFFVELQAVYIRAQIEAGAHAVWLGDCNAFSGMLSLEQYRRFAFPSCKRLVDRAHAAGAIIHLMNSEISVPYLLAESHDRGSSLLKRETIVCVFKETFQCQDKYAPTLPVRCHRVSLGLGWCWPLTACTVGWPSRRRPACSTFETTAQPACIARPRPSTDCN